MDFSQGLEFELMMESVVNALAGSSNYSTVVDTVFDGNENYLLTGDSYNDVQWVAIAYLATGNATGGKRYCHYRCGQHVLWRRVRPFSLPQDCNFDCFLSILEPRSRL